MIVSKDIHLYTLKKRITASNVEVIPSGEVSQIRDTISPKSPLESGNKLGGDKGEMVALWVEILP